MNAPSTRECPWCAETISAQARVCPHCRQWLSLRSLRHPLVGAVVILALLLGVGEMLLQSLERGFNPRPWYSETPGALTVLESRMNWVVTDKGPRIYVTGLLTNHSPQVWKDPEFECRFFNAAGQLIDVSHRTSFQTVAPAADSGFRLAVEPQHAPEEYGAFTVRVIHARHPRALF